MAEKLVVIILNSDPQNSAEILEPVYHATIAASMDYHAEIILAGRAGELAIRGVADKIEPGARRAKPSTTSSKKPTRAASSSRRANTSYNAGATTSSPK